MATFTPPVAPTIVPRYCPDSARIQKALFRHMRPLDRQVNTYVWSDGTVTTEYPVVLSDASLSSTVLHLPQDVAQGATVGPPEGASGGPFQAPLPYATIFNATSGVPVVTEYSIDPYLVYWFKAGQPYPNVSANLVAILTAAKFDNFLS